MPYILARYRDGHGCTAYHLDSSDNLIKLNRYLEEITMGKGIEIVVISRPVAYGEYKPYSFVYTVDDMINVVKEMVNNK